MCRDRADRIIYHPHHGEAMTIKTVPFTKARAEKIAAEFPTPFHIYDERAIRANARDFRRAFAVFEGFTNYFAVKALPNPYILAILKAEGFGADCSSRPELLLAERVGITGEHIMFTSNDTPADEFREARRLGAVINLDDISHIDSLEQACGIPALVSCRYNPGPLKGGNAIIGKPEEAKYGFTREQLLAGYARLKAKGATRFGLHTMVASNELDPAYFVETARLVFELAVEIKQRLGIQMELVNLGGGVGIPYRPDQTPVPYDRVAAGMQEAYGDLIVRNGLHPVRLAMECGRVVTGPYGWLVTRVIHLKETYRRYVGTDASMANLMRPGMYGAYHHITVLGKESAVATATYDVTGSLCENNDKFAIQRSLPEIAVGDLLAIHDTGAHGWAMGFNYNGKLRSAELLLREDGSVRLIRRAETVEDYFRTLDFSGLGSFR
jgi:diaminopimelate decarboxylase